MDNPQPASRRSNVSLSLSALDRLTTRPWLAATVLIIDVAWVGVSVTIEFAPRLELVFQTLVAAATLAMVFVIQHTQARQQAATQRKLDEILRALPEADNRFLALEHAADPEIQAAGRSHEDDRHTALREQAPLAED